MKFTRQWLARHLRTDASLDDILKGLTRIGLEVEGVENPAERLAGFRIARVVSAAPHPQADKLQLLMYLSSGALYFTKGKTVAEAFKVGKDFRPR